MAVTQNSHNGDGSNKNFEYTFQVLQDSDVKAEVDGALTTAFTLLTSPTRVSFTTAPPSGTNNVRLFRDTACDTAKYIFQPGSAIQASALNANLEQCLFAAQEEQGAMIGTARLVDRAVTSAKIKDETIVNADLSPTAEIAVSKLADGSARQVLQTASNGSDVEWTNNVDIPGTLDVTSSAAFDSNVTISGNTTVGGTLGITGTTTAAAINATSANVSGTVGIDGNFDVNTNKFTVAASSGNTVVAGDLEVGGTFDVTGTSNYTGQQTVPGGALVKDIKVGLDGNNEVSTTSGNLVLDSASGTVQVTDHFNATGNADVDGNLNVDGTLTVDGTSTLTGNTTVGGTLGVTGWGTFTKVISSNVDLDGGSIDGIVIGAANPAAGTFTTINASGAITGNLTGNASTATSLSAASVITNAEQGSHTANDTTFYTTSASDARYYNINTNEDITSGETWASNDTAVATTKAIDNRIVDIVDDVGGFVALDSEAAIPTNHPEKENATTADRVGTILSIKALSATYTPSGGTCTIPSGTLTNHSNAATITGCGTTVLSSGFGVLVETTAQTDAQYTAGPSFKFHRLVPKATEVTTVAGNISNINAVAGNATNINAVAGNATNINTVATNNTNVTNVGGSISNVNTVAGNITDVNNFADLYQIASSNPSTDGGGNSLAEGDLYFNTSADELKVWNGTAWQGGVTATGNFAVVTGNTWTGDNKYNDGVKALIGTGSDLEVFHASDVNNIKSVNGKIVLQTTAGNADIEVTPHGSGVVKLDGLSWPTADGSASQYLKTNGSGVLSWGTVTVGGAAGTDYNDGVKVRFGTDNDLEIYHDGTHGYLTNTTGDLRITDASAMILATNSLRLKNGANNATYIAADNGGAVELYYSNAKKIETTSTGATITGTCIADGLTLGDGEYIKLGDSNELKLHHDANGHSYFQLDSGKFFISANGGSDGIILTEKSTGDYMLWAKPAGGVNLYYDGGKKLETNSGGVSVTGSLVIAGDDVRDDNYKSKWGTGDDIQIYHDGGNSWLKNTTGSLMIDTNSIYFENVARNQNNLVINDNGSVDVYHAGAKKLETAGYGIGVYGYIQMGLGGSTWAALANDNIKIGLGNDQDLQLYHDGSNSYVRDAGTGSLILVGGNVTFQNAAQNANMLRATEGSGGGIELYSNNTKMFYTSSSGVHVCSGSSAAHLHLLDSGNLRIGTSNDLTLFHNGSNSFIDSITGNLYIRYGSGNFIQCTGSTGQVDLSYGNSVKLSTNASGLNTWGKIDISAGHIYIDDGYYVRLGNGEDFKLGHDGSNNQVYCDTGELRVHQGGAEAWRIDSSNIWNKRHLLPWTNGDKDLGSSSYRWNNLYINDLQLSNKGSQNDVDGTWGDWTLQEGENDIFMINNRSGKKYKMALTEVS